MSIIATAANQAAQYATTQTAAAIAQLPPGAVRTLGTYFLADDSKGETSKVDLTAGSDAFWQSGFGIFIKVIAGFATIALVVWGIVKAVMEAAKGRGGGIGQILRQVMPMFVFAALLSLITIIPQRIIDIIAWPIEQLLEFIDAQVQEAEKQTPNTGGKEVE